MHVRCFCERDRGLVLGVFPLWPRRRNASPASEYRTSHWTFLFSSAGWTSPRWPLSAVLGRLAWGCASTPSVAAPRLLWTTLRSVDKESAELYNRIGKEGKE